MEKDSIQERHCSRRTVASAMIFDVKQQTASPTYLVHAEAEKHQERPNFRLVWIGLDWIELGLLFRVWNKQFEQSLSRFLLDLTGESLAI